jgi:hypothetical protein
LGTRASARKHGAASTATFKNQNQVIAAILTRWRGVLLGPSFGRGHQNTAFPASDYLDLFYQLARVSVGRCRMNDDLSPVQETASLNFNASLALSAESRRKQKRCA